MRLTVPAQQVQEGGFVVIESGDWLFYGLVTDLQLGATDPRFADEQSEQRLPPELAKLLHGQTLYTNLEVLPALMLERGPEPGTPEYDRWQEQIDLGLKPRPAALPIKTIPPHHASVHLADAGRYRRDLRQSRKEGQLRDRLHPRARAPGVPEPGKIRAALVGRVRGDRHGQILPDPHPAGGLDPARPHLGADLRYAQRVRLRRHRLGHAGEGGRAEDATSAARSGWWGWDRGR